MITNYTFVGSTEKNIYIYTYILILDDKPANGGLWGPGDPTGPRPGPRDPPIYTYIQK